MKALRLFIAFALAAAIDIPAPVVLAQSAATAVSSCGSATYTAGQQYPLQQTTTGNQCTNASISGSVTVNSGAKATAAAPTYSEGTTDPVSQDLSGNQRVIVANPSNSPVNVTVNAPPNDVLTGPITCTAACAATTQVNSQGAGSVGITATGSGTGLSFIFQASLDGTNWFSVAAYTPAGVALAPGAAQSANGQWSVPASGWRFIRVNLSTISGGSEVFNVNSSAGSVVPPGQTVNVTSGKITINSPPNDVTAGPTACTSTSTCTAIQVSTQGSGSVGISLTGSGSGMAFTFQGSIDGTNWFAIGCLPPGLNPTPVSTGSANGDWFCPPAGYQLVRVDMTGFTSGTATITLNASAGSAQPVLGAVANAVELDGANGAALSATNPIFDAPVPTTSGGLSVKSFIVGNNTTSVAVKASAGQIYGITASSISASTPVWIKTYNIAQGSNTCGSNTPVQREMIPAPGASGGGTNIFYPAGVAFGTAISVCVTAGQADNDTTAPAAATYTWNIYFK